jgi:tetratricopeptide (TPR) repeat protein
MAILLHSIVEFNFHIPANAMLFFVILGLTVSTVNSKRTKDGEYSLLSCRTFTLKPRMKLAIYPLAVILMLGVSAHIVRGYSGNKYFQFYKTLSNRKDQINLTDTGNTSIQLLKFLNKTLSVDPSNAEYHYELGRLYTQMMGESWKGGEWRLENGKWVFDPGEKSLNYGLKAMDSYSNAINLQPTNAWYHLSLGWIIDNLSIFGHNNKLYAQAADEYRLAIILDPNNRYIKACLAKKRDSKQ